MGATQSTLDVQTILTEISPSTSEEEPLPSLTLEESELETLLKSHGISRNDATLAQMQQCHALVTAPQFWSTHYTLHPNDSRVEKWIWVHSRHKAQCAALKESAEKLKSTPVEKRRFKMELILRKYKQLVQKLEAHSEFENTQLFKYFEENHEDMVEHMKTLKGQHDDMCQGGEIREAFQSAMEGEEVEEDKIDEVVKLLEGFEKGVEEHMQEEESILLNKWLNLSEEEYKKYRTYLSWMYAIMY